MSSCFLLKWGAQIPYLFYENQTPRSDSANFEPSEPIFNPPNSGAQASSAAGTRNSHLFHCSDWLPTLVGLAKGSLVRNKPLDGVDIWQALLDPNAEAPRHELLINANSLPNRGAPVANGSDPTRQAQLQQGGALIVQTAAAGRLKLVLPGGWPLASVSDRFLFNLSNDERELHNLYNSTDSVLLELRASMERRLDELASEAVTPMTWFRPFQGAGYFCAKCPMGNTSGALDAWLPWATEPDIQQSV